MIVLCKGCLHPLLEDDLLIAPRNPQREYYCSITCLEMHEGKGVVIVGQTYKRGAKGHKVRRPVMPLSEEVEEEGEDE